MRPVIRHFAILFTSVIAVCCFAGADWLQFRGPGGAGSCPSESVPTSWSDDEGITWKTALPGPGSSSPIIQGDRVFVTCYSGYGEKRGDAGSMEDLKRHLVCLDRKSGKILWQKTIDAVMPEDAYSGMGVPEHGYASNTPVVDSERVYAFFGKTGVFAFDLDGNQLWQVDVGHESSNRRWGSAASLLLYKDYVIVNASEESQTIRALDKATGKEVWKAEAAMLELAYGTPVIVELPDGEKELVIGVPQEVWALNPDTGKIKWYCATRVSGNVSPSPVTADGIVYILGGYPRRGTAAIRTGGKGDVTDSHLVWESTTSSYIPSAVLHEGRLHWVGDDAIAYCLDAKTGDAVYRERVPGTSGGGRGKPFYSSTTLIGNHLYAVSRTGGTYVLATGPEFSVVSQNKIESDTSQFNGSPAVCRGQLFLRSDRFMYCVGTEK